MHARCRRERTGRRHAASMTNAPNRSGRIASNCRSTGCESLRRHHGAGRCDLDVRGGRVRHPARALGLGQDDAADDGRRPYPARSGEVWIDGKRRRPTAAAPARHRHGLPELRAVPAPDRLREHRLSAAHAADAARPRSRSASRDALEMVQLPDVARRACRASFPAASSSASRWRAASSTSPRSS